MLNPHFGIPLEREFEIWITQQIEDYFLRLGVTVSTFAVSPADEKTWPSDEALLANGKLVGIQYKRPHLSRKTTGTLFSKLWWSLSNPKGQASAVLACPEIYYCLPTFINRKWRREALAHAIFWRPNPSDFRPRESADHTIWYENSEPHLRTQNIKIARHENAYRWGEFVERIIGCSVPSGFDRSVPAKHVLQRIRQKYAERSTQEGKNVNRDYYSGSEVIYFMYFPQLSG
ncbi:hypothetical protein [Perlucidibaca piscinae]|uniref:hypothetical protein n=1 Tax=Perlucidibaca piscinae TaxID=392589 RepID=UPI0012EBAAE3|nr:hypothetical protein [Perlucidibaca piscinae]